MTLYARRDDPQLEPTPGRRSGNDSAFTNLTESTKYNPDHNPKKKRKIRLNLQAARGAEKALRIVGNGSDMWEMLWKAVRAC